MASAVFKTVCGALTCPGWVRFLHAPAREKSKASRLFWNVKPLIIFVITLVFCHAYRKYELKYICLVIVIMEASLGQYINPLTGMLLGVIVKEVSSI